MGPDETRVETSTTRSSPAGATEDPLRVGLSARVRRLDPGRRQALVEVPRLLINGRKGTALERVLTDGEYLLDRILDGGNRGAPLLFDDFHRAAGFDESRAALFRSVGGSLEASVPVLLDEPGQLVAQVYARLVSAGLRDIAQRFEQQARGPWLRLWVTTLGQGVRLVGHGAVISSVAMSRSGEFVLAAFEDGTLQSWDRAGMLRNSLGGVADVLADCAISAEGRIAVSVSRNGRIDVWDTSTARGVQLASPHRGLLTACAIDHDGRRAVVSSRDGTLSVWSLPDGELLERLEGHDGEVHCCSISAGGDLVASGSYDRTVRLWRLGGRGREVLAMPWGAPVRVRLSAKGDVLYTLATGWTIDDHNDYVDSSTFSLLTFEAPGSTPEPRLPGETLDLEGDPDANMIEIFGEHLSKLPKALHVENRLVRVWSLGPSGAAQRAILTHDRAVAEFAVADTADRVLTATNDGRLSLWAVDGKEPLLSWADVSNTVAACAIDDKAKVAVTASRQGSLRIWELDSVESKGGPRNGPLFECSFALDGKRVVGIQGRSIVLWDAESGKPVGSDEIELPEGIAPRKLARRGLRGLASGGWSLSDISRVHVFTLEDPAGSARVLPHPATVEGLAISPRGDVAVTGSSDGVVRLWQLDGDPGVPVVLATDCPRGLLDAAFAGDGERVVALTGDDQVLLFDVAAGRPLLSTRNRHAGAACLAVNDAGTRAATVATDGSLRIWELAKGQVNLAATWRVSRSPSEVGLYCALDEAGEWLLVSAPEQRLTAISTRDGTTVAALTLDTGVRSLAWGTGRQFVAGDLAGGIHLGALELPKKSEA